MYDRERDTYGEPSGNDYGAGLTDGGPDSDHTMTKLLIIILEHILPQPNSYHVIDSDHLMLAF